MISKIESIRRELVALKRSIDPHLTDPRRYEILRDDLNPIWGRLEALLHTEESEIPLNLTDWEKARDAVAVVVRTLKGDERIGAMLALVAICEGMRDTLVSGPYCSWCQAPLPEHAPACEKFGKFKENHPNNQKIL